MSVPKLTWIFLWLREHGSDVDLSPRLLLPNPLYFTDTTVLPWLSLSLQYFYIFIINSTGKSLREGGSEGEKGDDGFLLLGTEEEG